MGSTYWYYPQQIYATKLIQNKEKYEFSKQKRARDLSHLQNI